MFETDVLDESTTKFRSLEVYVIPPKPDHVAGESNGGAAADSRGNSTRFIRR
jgi:hypothetical protein